MQRTRPRLRHGTLINRYGFTGHPSRSLGHNRISDRNGITGIFSSRDIGNGTAVTGTLISTGTSARNRRPVTRSFTAPDEHICGTGYRRRLGLGPDIRRARHRHRRRLGQLEVPVIARSAPVGPGAAPPLRLCGLPLVHLPPLSPHLARGNDPRAATRRSPQSDRLSAPRSGIARRARPLTMDSTRFADRRAEGRVSRGQGQRAEAVGVPEADAAGAAARLDPGPVSGLDPGLSNAGTDVEGRIRGDSVVVPLRSGAASG